VRRSASACRGKITFYSARHTYASRLYRADVPLPLIAQNMGRNPAEIETYLKEFDTDRIISANKRVWQIPDPARKDPKTGAGCKPPCKPSRHARL